MLISGEICQAVASACVAGVAGCSLVQEPMPSQPRGHGWVHSNYVYLKMVLRSLGLSIPRSSLIHDIKY